FWKLEFIRAQNDFCALTLETKKEAISPWRLLLSLPYEFFSRTYTSERALSVRMENENNAKTNATIITIEPTWATVVTDSVFCKTKPPIAEPNAIPNWRAELLKL